MMSSTRLTWWPTPFLALWNRPPLRKEFRELPQSLANGAKLQKQAI